MHRGGLVCIVLGSLAGSDACRWEHEDQKCGEGSVEFHPHPAGRAA